MDNENKDDDEEEEEEDGGRGRLLRTRERRRHTETNGGWTKPLRSSMLKNKNGASGTSSLAPVLVAATAHLVNPVQWLEFQLSDVPAQALAAADTKRCGCTWNN